MRVSVIIPSLRRPVSLLRCVKAFLTNSDVEGIELEIVCALSRGDTVSHETVAKLGVVLAMESEPLTGAVLAVNAGAQAATGDILVFSGDDCIPFPNWLRAAITCFSMLPDSSGVVGLNDLQRGSRDGKRFATHHMATRAFLLEHYGAAFWCPHYKHYYTDVELCEVAARTGHYIWCEDAILAHNRVEDEITTAGKTFYRDDMQLYETRRKVGFPVNWEPILKVTYEDHQTPA